MSRFDAFDEFNGEKAAATAKKIAGDAGNPVFGTGCNDAAWPGAALGRALDGDARRRPTVQASLFWNF